MGYCCHIINITLCKRGINLFEQRRTGRLQKFRATAAPFVVDIRELFFLVLLCLMTPAINRSLLLYRFVLHDIEIRACLTQFITMLVMVSKQFPCLSSRAYASEEEG